MMLYNNEEQFFDKLLEFKTNVEEHYDVNEWKNTYYELEDGSKLFYSFVCELLSYHLITNELVESGKRTISMYKDLLNEIGEDNGVVVIR